MSEIPSYRHKLDDTHFDNWRLGFLLYSQNANTTMEAYAKYTALITTLPTEHCAMFSLYDKSEVLLSLRVLDTTQSRALLIGHAALVNAFDKSGEPFALSGVRIARINPINDQQEPNTLIDISLNAIDLDLEIRNLADITDLTDL